jgi:hypothetical protein
MLHAVVFPSGSSCELGVKKTEWYAAKIADSSHPSQEIYFHSHLRLSGVSFRVAGLLATS